MLVWLYLWTLSASTFLYYLLIHIYNFIYKDSIHSFINSFNNHLLNTY